MGDQTDSQTEGTETEESTQTSQDSEPTSGESKDSLAVDDVVTALVGSDTFMERIRRIAQGEKDKGNAAALEQVGELSERLNELAPYLPNVAAKDIAEAVDKADTAKILKQFREGTLVQPTPGSVLGQAEVEQLASSLTEGLTQEIQDKIVADAKAQAFDDPNKLEQYIITSVATEGQKPQPTEAQTIQQSSTQTPVSASDAEVGTKLETILSNPDLTFNQRMEAMKKHDDELAVTTYEQ